METHSSILAWRIPWTEEPGGLQSVRSQRVRHDWTTSLACLLVKTCRNQSDTTGLKEMIQTWAFSTALGKTKNAVSTWSGFAGSKKDRQSYEIHPQGITRSMEPCIHRKSLKKFPIPKQGWWKISCSWSQPVKPEEVIPLIDTSMFYISFMVTIKQNPTVDHKR